MSDRTQEIADIQARIIQGYAAEFTPGIMALYAEAVVVPVISLFIQLFWGA